MESEPPTEPIPPAPPPASAFAHLQYRFTTGVRAGRTVHVRGANDEVLLTYRSFASVVGVVAALVAAIVALAGSGGVALLIAEGALVRAVIAVVLTVAFSLGIAMLVPRANVTLYEGSQPALTISQRGGFPSATYVVTTPNGAILAELRKTFLSPLARNRWTITHEGRYLGEAHEESFSGALLRKLLGKFSRAFETNVVITAGVDAGRILRRPDPAGRVDVLELTSDAVDRRVAVALATLVLGSEP